MSFRFNTRVVLLFGLLCASFFSASAQTRNLTVAVLVNSQNTTGYNQSPTTPGEFQRFAERYLEHLQVPYEIFDVATVAPPLDLSSRQLIIAGHSGLTPASDWRDAITAAVNAGTGFVNLDSSVSIGSQSHIAAIFGSTGSVAGTAATQISIPAAVAPGGSSPHYIAAFQKRYDGGSLVYAFHADDGGVVRSVSSTVLQGASGTVIALLGSNPLILAKTFGTGRAVNFGTLDYLRADRFGFEMGVDDLFWRSLVWAARKPFVVRGYPRFWSVQMDDTRLAWPTRVGDMYNPALTGQLGADGTGGPWKVTGYLYTDNLPPGSSGRATIISDIKAGKIEVAPHTFSGDVNCGNLYWGTCTGALNDQQWLNNMTQTDAWKQGNGGTDTIPSISRALVAHYWDISNNTGYDLWNHYGIRYITSIQKAGFQSTLQYNGAERLPARPFWNYQMPPKVVADSNTPTENYPFFFADDFNIGSRAGLPAQTFFLFATQYLDFSRYSRVDFAWPNAAANPTPTVASSVGQLKQYTWRHWSGLGPLQLFTHDAANYEGSSAGDRQDVIAQSSAWLNSNGVRHVFMDDLGDYIYARTKSSLTRATFDGSQLSYTFTGRSANADGTLIPTQLLVFAGDNDGAWQNVPGFTSGLQVARSMPPALQSISPTQGAGNGGTVVTLSGFGFTPDATVVFGQNASPNVTYVSSTTLQAVTPAGNAGAVDVKVVSSNGTSILPSSFTYLPPPRQLVAAYGFNEGTGTTVADSSGTGNNGTINGATWNATGKFGKALSFNGSSDWVTVSNSSNLGLTTGMTLEAWINPSALGTPWRTVILKEQPGEMTYALYANTGAGRPATYVYLGAEVNSTSATALATNTWSHLAATYDGTTLKVYINGVEVSSQAVSGTMLPSTGALRIGGNSVWGEYFSGLIDEVRIYDRASTPAEIQADMNLAVGAADTTAPTVSLTAPAAGSTVSGNVTVSANASDNIGVAGVQFMLDGAPLGTEDTTAPYSISWNSATAATGPHSLTARARDASGNQTTSTAVNVTVAPDTTAPTVSVTSPANGATVTGTVSVSANASDNVAVVGVQFLLDGSSLGAEQTTAPYSISWNSATVANGAHTLSARARDAAGNQTTSAVVNVTTSNVPADLTPPTVSITAPTDGASVWGSVTVSANASDNVGVAGVQFLLDGSALGTEDTTAPYSTTWDSTAVSNGSHTLSAVARDAAGNQTTSTTILVTRCCSVWNSNTAPGTAASPDSASVELGVRFRSDVNGIVKGIRFYKGATNTGTHVGNLWTQNGVLLASANFTNESASGWQEVSFSTPVAIVAGTTYVASYFAPAGNYALNLDYFTAAGVDSAPLHLLKDGVDGGNGVYTYGTVSSFPTSSFRSSNYWVDVVFAATGGGGSTAPNVTSTSPVSGATGVNIGSTVTATFDRSLDPATVTASTVQLRDSGNTLVPASLAYNDASKTITLSPTFGLNSNSNYSALLVGGASGLKGTDGTPITTSVSWAFTTAPPAAGSCPCSVWDATAVPGTIDSFDSGAVELGVKFRTTVNGFITGIRFYKSTANTGTHTGHLWTTDGTLVASATFSNETSSGWQQVTFPSAVAVTAGTTYIASYYAPNGRYSVNQGQFASAGVSNPPLQLLQTGVDGLNGVYNYGPAPTYPTASFNSSNYWVDVVFMSTVGGAFGPTITAVSPASGSTGAATSTTVTATFDKQMDPATVTSATVKFFDSLGNPVASTVAYNSSTAVITPANPLNSDTSYQTVITGGLNGVKDSSGNPMTTNVSWNFRTNGSGTDTTPPAVSMSAPANNAAVSGNVTVSATASDNVGVVGVQFLLDGAALGTEDTVSPYSISWNSATVANGAHTLSARARDAAGNQTTTTVVTVTTANDTTAPTVSMTAPANGASLTGTVTVSATATDNVAVTGVQFLLDGASLGTEDTVAPYSISWNTTAVQPGTHTLSARARDAAGNLTTSAAATITTFDSVAPTVTMSAPANNATVSGTAVTVSANASDNIGVVGVQFLLDGVALGTEDTVAPFSISWNSFVVPNGTHTLSARARDAAGNQTTSAARTVTVSNDHTAPTVSMTAPLNLAIVRGTITISASASDNVRVVGVQFLLDGAALGAEDTSSPYSRSWNTGTVPIGLHTLAARARDAAGNQTTSAARTVTVTR
jgi:hypothetical protein